MILNATYETKTGTIKKTFIHKYKHVLFESARNCKEYRDCHSVTFELEEVDEYGNKCGEC